MISQYSAATKKQLGRNQNANQNKKMFTFLYLNNCGLSIENENSVDQALCPTLSGTPATIQHYHTTQAEPHRK